MSEIFSAAFASGISGGTLALISLIMTYVLWIRSDKIKANLEERSDNVKDYLTQKIDYVKETLGGDVRDIKADVSGAKAAIDAVGSEMRSAIERLGQRLFDSQNHMAETRPTRVEMQDTMNRMIVPVREDLAFIKEILLKQSGARNGP